MVEIQTQELRLWHRIISYIIYSVYNTNIVIKMKYFLIEIIYDPKEN